MVRVIPATRECNERARFFNIYTFNKTLNFMVGLDTRYFVYQVLKNILGEGDFL